MPAIWVSEFSWARSLPTVGKRELIISFSGVFDGYKLEIGYNAPMSIRKEAGTPSAPQPSKPTDAKKAEKHSTNPKPVAGKDTQEREVGGRDGPDPTRFGDWEKNGRCIDF